MLPVFIEGDNIGLQFVEEILALAQLVVAAHPFKSPFAFL
jgi:hypothetical protein